MSLNPGAALAALRKTGPVTCCVCGQVFQARLTVANNGKRYCSNRCKQAEKYRNRKTPPDLP